MSPDAIGNGHSRGAPAFASLWTLCLLAALSCGLPRAVHAQDDTPRSVTLAEVLRYARTRAPEVRAALAALDRVEAERALAQADYLPCVVTEGTSGLAYSNAVSCRVFPA